MPNMQNTCYTSSGIRIKIFDTWERTKDKPLTAIIYFQKYPLHQAPLPWATFNIEIVESANIRFTEK